MQPSFSYIGNPDYRGYLSSLAQGGDNMASDALSYVGNDGQLNPGGATTYHFDTPGQSTWNDLNSYNSNQYANFQKFNPSGGQVLGDSTVASPAAAPGDLAYLNDQEGQLRGMLGSAQTTLGNGLTQLGDSYNQGVNQSNQARATADANYGTQLQDTTTAKQGAIDRVDTGARTLADSVRRILGLAGGSNSSAYQLAAPSAVAQNASTQRSGVEDTYAKNFRDINTAQSNADTQFEQALQDLATQKQQKEEALRQGVLTQEQGIYGDLGNIASERAQLAGGGYSAVKAATAPDSTAIAQRQAALDSLFSQFRTPVSVQAPTVSTPSLSDYIVNPTTLNTGQGNGSDTSPYAQFLLKKLQGQSA